MESELFKEKLKEYFSIKLKEIEEKALEVKKLKDKTGAVDKLLKLAALTKVNEFFEGFIKINREMNWPTNKIHGNFNQVTTSTGRLSSTKPNLQNMPPELQTFVRSEYE